MGGTQGRDAYIIDIGIITAIVFCRCCVRTKERGFHTNAPVGHDGSRHTQHAQLCFFIKTVSGLDLDAGDAFGDQYVNTAQRIFQQLGLSRAARRLDGRHDPATRTRNFFITRPVQTHFELNRAVTTVHNMRVAIDQTRRDKTPAKAGVGSIGKMRVQVRFWSNPLYHSAIHDDGRIFNQAIGTPRVAHGRSIQINENFDVFGHFRSPMAHISLF